MSTDDHDFVMLDADIEESDESTEPLSSEELSEIQKWLEPTDYFGTSSEYKKHCAAHLAGTGAWVAETDQFRQWHDSPDRGALWIKATAGAGKSVIAASMASQLSVEESVPVLFFFFRHIVSANQKPQSLVRDYMSQLLEHSQELQHSLQSLIENGRSLGSVGFDELWSILAAALTRLPRVYCVADALDEMDGENESFLQDVLALSRRMPASIKILMTSRPLPRVEKIFRDPYVLQIGLQARLVDPDISFYVKHRTAEFDVTESLRFRLHETMCARAEGHFLYARLMMDELLHSYDSGDEESLLSALKTLPVPMADMYTQMLLDHSRRSGVPQELQITLLQWVTRSERPLRLLELSAMIDCDHKKASETPKNTKSMVREGCGPLLEILEDETVCPIHHSLTEYLYDQTRSESALHKNGFPVLDDSDAHRNITHTCLKYLVSGWHTGPGLNALGFQDISRLNLDNPLLDYAARNWWKHLRKSQAESCATTFADIDRLFVNDSKLLRAWQLYVDRDLVKTGRHRPFDPTGASPMHFAADMGLEFYVSHLIDTGHNMEAVDGEFKTPLTVAASEGHHEVVRVLLKSGCNNDPDDYQGLKPLHHAASCNHHRTVKLLLESGVDPLTKKTKENPGRTCGNAPITVGQTALQYACEHDHVETVREFIPYLDGENLQAALHQALWSQSVRVAQVLLEGSEIDVNRRTYDQTPFYLAARTRDTKLMKLLLRMGADANVMCRKGDARRRNFKREDNALHCFAGPTQTFSANANPDAEDLIVGFELLFDAGLDPRSVDDQGFNTLHSLLSSPSTYTNPQLTDLDPIVRYLVYRGVPVISLAADGSNAFHIAQELPGHTIKLLISLGLRVDQIRRSDGQTPLMLAIGQNRLEYAKELLAHGADPNIVDFQGNTVLHKLTKSNRNADNMVETAQILFDAGCDINSRNQRGETALHVRYKSIHGLKEDRIFALFVRHGFDLEAKDRVGETILLQSVRFAGLYDNEKAAIALLDAGCDPKARDYNGATALHKLCGQKHTRHSVVDRARFWLDKGVDPLSTDFAGNTLWHSLAHLGRGSEKTADESLMKFLVECKVPATARNNAGLTPLQLACFKGDSDYNHALVEFLLSNICAPINAPDMDGICPLHAASAAGSVLVSVLLERGADPEAVTSDFQSPLIVACRNHQWEATYILLDHYKTRNQLHMLEQVDRDGRTALHYVCGSGRAEIAALLLEAGAKVDVVDKHGMTPLALCAEDCDNQFSKDFESVAQGFNQPYDLSEDVRRVLLPIKPTRPCSPNREDPRRMREVVRLLINGGADVSFLTKISKGYFYREGEIQNPLFSALRGGNELVLSELLLAQKKILDSRDFPIERETVDSEGSMVDYDSEAQAIEKYWRNILRVRCNRNRFPELASSIEPVSLSEEFGSDSSWKLRKLLADDNEPLFKQAANYGAKVLDITSNGDCAILQMASWGCVGLVRSFSSEARTANARWAKEQTAQRESFRTPIKSMLQHAAARDLPNLDMLKLLITELGHDPNEACSESFNGNYSCSLVHIVVKSQHWWHIGALEYLLESGADLEALDSEQNTPLLSALRAHTSHQQLLLKRRIVETLLARGANPNAMDKEGLTCLNIASDKPGLCLLLLRYGAKPEWGAYPSIFDAIIQGDIAYLRGIIDSGANVNCRMTPRWDGETLRLAHRGRQYARRNLTNPDWLNISEAWELCFYAYPIHVAASHIFNAFGHRDNAILMIQLLLEAGADTSLIYEDGKSIAHVLASTGGLLDPILNYPGFETEATDSGRRTILLAACDFVPPSSQRQNRGNRLGSEEFPPLDRDNVPKLLEHGASASAVDECGLNALHHLIRSRSSRGAQFMQTVYPLLFLASQPDLAGRTPLHYALAKHSLEVIEPLIKNGADPLTCDPLDGTSALHHLVRRLHVVEATRENPLVAPSMDGLFVTMDRSTNESPSDDTIRVHLLRSQQGSDKDQPDVQRSFLRHLIAKMLVRGISINARDHFGNAPLFKFIESCSTDPSATSRLLPCLQELESVGADFTVRNKSGESALHKLAAYRINRANYRFYSFNQETTQTAEAHLVATASWLVANGVDVTWEDDRSRTCLDVAASSGSEWMLDMYKRK